MNRQPDLLKKQYIKGDRLTGDIPITDTVEVDLFRIIESTVAKTIEVDAVLDGEASIFILQECVKDQIREELKKYPQLEIVYYDS